MANHRSMPHFFARAAPASHTHLPRPLEREKPDRRRVQLFLRARPPMAMLKLAPIDVNLDLLPTLVLTEYSTTEYNWYLQSTVYRVQYQRWYQVETLVETYQRWYAEWRYAPFGFAIACFFGLDAAGTPLAALWSSATRYESAGKSLDILAATVRHDSSEASPSGSVAQLCATL